MEDNQTLLNTGVDHEGNHQLMETARWSKLFAVITLVGIGLIVLIMIFSWSNMMSVYAEAGLGGAGAGSLAFLGVFIAIFVAIAVILLTFLLKGANRIKRGLVHKDQVMFNAGLASLKNYFVMLGAITVIQAIFFLFGLIS